MVVGGNEYAGVCLVVTISNMSSGYGLQQVNSKLFQINKEVGMLFSQKQS